MTPPSGARFCGYDLRATDPDAARVFYADAVGLEVPDGLSVVESAVAETAVAAWPLHEQARARGAPPHWLGHVGVADVEGTLARLIERGSEQLGPLGRTRDGTLYARLRDSSGADGAQLVPCEDPQGAAFGLYQAPPDRGQR